MDMLKYESGVERWAVVRIHSCVLKRTSELFQLVDILGWVMWEVCCERWVLRYLNRDGEERKGDGVGER